MWHKFALNSQNVVRETAKAVLIALPHKSNFDGFEFWYPKKLVRQGSHSYQLIASIPDDMQITARRTSPKTYKVLDEKELTPADVIEAFGGETQAVSAVKAIARETRFFEERRIEKHIPERIIPTEVNADETLIR